MLRAWLQRLQRTPKPPRPRAIPAVNPLYNTLLARVGEYNPKVQGKLWYETVDKMRNNSRIMALEYILTLPITATHWEVYPPKSASSDAREAADLLNKDLTEQSRTTLYDLIRLAILARFYGFRAFEPVYSLGTGRVYTDDIIDIHPTTIHRIEFDDNGQPTAIIQRPPQKSEIQIPWQDLVVFTWRREGGDPLGYPDLRSLYPDWYRLEYLYSILSVAAERAGIGAWQAVLPRNLYDNDQLRREILSILKSIRSYEGGALIVPEGVTIDVLKAVEQQGIDALLRLAQHYETNLATAILANITQLGMRDIGTQALAQVLFDMFLLQLNHTARWLADTINTQLVRQWMSYNYPQLPPDQHPNLQYTDLRLLLKRESVVDAIIKTVQASIIPTDPNLENYIRDILSLPPPSQEQPVANFAKIAPPDAQPQNETIHLQRKNDPIRSEEQFAQTLENYLKTIENLNAPALQQSLESLRQTNDPQEQSRIIQSLAKFELDGREQYESLLYDYLHTFAIEARAALARDYNQRINPSDMPAQLDAYIRAKASTLARDHYEKLRAQIVYEALAESLKTTPTLNPNKLVRNITSQRINTDLEKLNTETGALIKRINAQLNE